MKTLSWKIRCVVLGLGAVSAAFGCAQILGLGDYAEKAGSFDGGGTCDVDLSTACYPCTATTDRQLLNACTTSGCVPFDKKRLTNLLPDGGLPPVQPVVNDGGTPDAALPDGSSLPSCLSLNANPVVVVAGTAKPYVQALAAAIFNDGSPVTIIYKGRSSCDAWNAILQGTPVTGTASYWAASPTESICDLPSGGLQPDVIIADVFPSTCLPLPNGLPKDVADFQGPVQTMEFVVPKASTQTSITAQAAYFVYGFGAGSGVSPWTDPSFIFRLDDASGTQAILGSGIGVPGPSWKGTNVAFSSQMVTALTGVPSASAEKAIGILSAVNLTDQVRVAIHPLAYQHYGQSCSYYADTSETSKDKRNVRDGHYALWGPLHLSTKLDTSGFPLKQGSKRVIDTLTGSFAPPKGLDLIEAEALNNLVPTCAMHVSRNAEVGPLKPNVSSTPCGCYFELKASGTTSCKTCNTPSDCPSSAPSCSFGYCEAQ